MGSVEGIVTNVWKGLDARGRSTRSERNQLDAPRELVNMLVDENGHLLMPSASELVHSFDSAQGRVLQMGYIEHPRGILVQMETGKVYHFNLPISGSWSSTDLAVTDLIDLLAPDDPIWALSGINLGFFGNATRGAGPHTGQTITVDEDGTGAVIATDQSGPDLPQDGQASYSTFWKGRRFVVVRGRSVWFSELNQPLTYLEDNLFTIGGDDAGNDWPTSPGFVQGMVSWEDVLLFFLQSSVWMLTGGGDTDSWQLRDTIAAVGNSSPWALQTTQHGVFTLGAGAQGDLGVYVFRGSSAEKVSSPVDELINGQIRSAQQFGYYILSVGKPSVDSLQFLLYDIRQKLWTSYDGFRHGVAVPTPHGFFVSDGLDLYFTPINDRRTFPRKSGRSGRVTLGWEDEGNTAGLVRILGVKVAGKRSGSGTPTIQATVRTPNGGLVTSPAVDVPTDVFDNLVVPVNVRGSAAEITLEITPGSDSSEVLIESLQLVYSRKGEKLSRGTS